MTALAAYLRLRGPAQPRQEADRILRGLEIYGRETGVTLDGSGVAVGRRLFASLPEDANDRGPVVGAGGRWILSADIRLDARAELCHDLGLKGPEPKRLSDSAIAMRAIERWQVDAIPKLIGDFALILWDEFKRRLILARDFHGMRPLHFHRNPAFVAVASMPKGLHALPDVGREPDETAIAEFLALLPESESGTFFRGIERVTPGEIVTIESDGGLTRHVYWNPTPRRLNLTDEDYADAIRESLDRATEARLRGGGVGTQLSGGLDSSAVTATAARLSAPDKIIAFTAAPRKGLVRRTFPGRFNDESGHAAEVARLYPNIDHVIFRTAAASPFSTLDRNFFLYERPILNLCNMVWVHGILDLAKQRQLRTLLVGDMGNLTFSYHGLSHLSELVGAGQFLRAARCAVGLKRNGTRILSSASQIIGPLLPRTVWTEINRLAGRSLDLRGYSLVAPHRADLLARTAEARGVDLTYRPATDSFEFRKAGVRRFDDGNFNKGVLAGWGLTISDPTADRRLVELCLSIPSEQFLKGGLQRSLARRAFADRLPGRLISETRKGYQAADWYEGLQAAWSEAVEHSERIAAAPAASGIIDANRLRDLLADNREREWDSPDEEAIYRLTVLRGISVGHFVRRAAGANS